MQPEQDDGGHRDLVLEARTAGPIGQAKSILLERHKIGSVAAFEMLVQASQSTNLELVDIARWMAGEMERPGEGPPPASGCRRRHRVGAGMDSPSDRPAVLRSGLSAGGMTLDDLWAACIAIGDSLTTGDLDAALAGRTTLTDHQHDVVAQALDDRFIEMGLDHLVPYARDVDGGAPGSR